VKHKKYHIFIGVLSLFANIVLPTFIIKYYQLITNVCEKKETAVYVFFAFLVLFWFITLAVTLYELGGYLLHTANHDYENYEGRKSL